MKIGYLIPEFPSQTHNFFWRESQALEEIGIQPAFVSTKKPVRKIMSASWAEDAQRKTTYLFPPSISETIQSILFLLLAGPSAWFRCFQIIATASDMTFQQKQRLLLLIPLAAKLVKVSRRQGWSHIHVHSCADAANVAMFASVISDITYSFTLHNPLYVYGPNQENKWRHAEFAVVINNQVYAEVNEKLHHVLPEFVEVAPMGVNCSKFERTTPYSPYAAEGSFKVFSCGRLNLIKGHCYLIQAVSMLRTQGINITLEIAGEDEQGGLGYRLELEALIRELHLEEFVRLLGAVSEETIKDALENAHVFTLASLDEGVPVAAMEAMAMEVPVIVTDVGGVTELVEDGVDGIVIQPKDADAVKDALLKVYEDQELASRLGQAGRRKVVQSFTHRRSAEVIASLVEKVVSRSQL